MVVGSIVMAIGGLSFTGWKSATEQRGTADRLQSELRKASTLATTEGRTYCVEVRSSAQTVQRWRYRCEASGSPVGTKVGGAAGPQGSHVTLTPRAPIPAVTGTRPCPTGSTCVYFYPRGTATPAKFEVGSSKRSQTYTINVEGLTSRVYR